MHDMLLDWHWIPGVSVGPFRFGEKIERYVVTVRLVKLPRDCCIAHWDTYAIPGTESQVLAEDARVADVHCCDRLEYTGINLLGMSVEEIRDVLGREEEFADGVGLGSAMYYEERLGLTLWIVDGSVRSATCGCTAQELDRQDEEEKRRGKRLPA